MEKFKKISKINVTNKMVWITFVVGMLIVICTAAAIWTIGYVKAKSNLANANVEKQEENIIEQENLVDTSQMSEEELKKLNEKEQKEKNEKDNNTKTNTVKNKYYIKVNYGAQVVTIYTYDKNGSYTIPVRACVCSTGAATPTYGVYRLSWKATWGKLFGNVWGHYCYQIVGDILFHSVPYLQNKNDTLVSAYYDRLGSKDSMGCIRLTTIDAKWIYDNCPSGTQVEFYSSSNPGPLGKPTAQKVSNAPGDLKNWDPTDPDPKNPWKTYKEEEEKPSQNTTNTEITNNENTNTEINDTVENNTTENNTTENTQNENNNSEVNNENIETPTEGNTEGNNTESNPTNEETNTETDTSESNENQQLKDDNTLTENSHHEEFYVDNKEKG